MQDAKPAASLILMRDRRSAPPELLVVQRAKALAFAGGAYAFPGGRVEAEDAGIALRLCPHLDGEDGAARIAAVRETIEETGIAAALAPAPDRATIAAWRAEGVTLPDPVVFDDAALVPFARWLPQEQVVRRFDTRFYLAAADSDHAPDPDGSETAHAFWATAGDMLARCRADDGRALFPTRRILERLAGFASFAAAREDALGRPQRIITPWVERRGDVDWLRIPADAGYPVFEEPADSALRH